MKRIINSIAVMALMLLGLVSCIKEGEPVTFMAALEQPEEYQNGKSYLSDEHFILWDEDDAIAVQHAKASGEGTGDTAWAYCATGGVREAGFYGNTSGSMASSSRPWIGFFPATAYDGSNHLIYPSIMPYRNDAQGDFTFGKACFPMVAFSSAGTAMGFHSVSGIVRVQLFSSLTTTATIQSIEFTSENGPISGSFSVKNITTNSPYLSSTSTADADKKISITGINKTIGGSSKSPLLTFYLPLPATSDGSGSNLTNYVLSMKVVSDKGTFIKRMSVDIRRNAINKMPAIEINEWNVTDVGPAHVHMVGCGTKERPFQIYTYDDLVKARTACNATGGTINGQAITENTYFKVVRVDILLGVEGTTPGHYGDYNASTHHSQYQTCGPWTEGFRNFKGHFYCSSSHPTLHGIINNSHTPLFESISAQGHVDSVTVRSTVDINITETAIDNFSPLCLSNSGKMSNCVNKCNVTCAHGNVAGICITNAAGGVLNGCRNEASLTAQNGKNVAGLCLTNSGTVRRSQMTTTATLSGSQVGGLVHTNSGSVEASYVTLSNSSAQGHFGGIVYLNNNGATVQNCYVSGSLIAQSGCTVGGIVNNNQLGNILGCYNKMSALKGSVNVGGICAVMNGGVLRNCYVDGTSTAEITTPSDAVANVGGFVGLMQAGTIDNGYTVANVHNGSSLVGNQAGNIAAKIESGSNTVKIWNCYGTANVDFVGARSGSNITISDCYGRIAINDVTVHVTPITIDGFQVFLSSASSDPYAFWNTLKGNLASYVGSIHYNSWIYGNHPVLSASK